MGKVVDYSEHIAYYHNLSKHRPLLDFELERLTYLVQREKDLVRERRYREAHKEEIKAREKARDYTKDGKPRAKTLEKWRRNNKLTYERNRADRIERSRKWRENNPEKYQALMDIKNERRRAAAKAKREEKEGNRNEKDMGLALR